MQERSERIMDYLDLVDIYELDSDEFYEFYR